MNGLQTSLISKSKQVYGHHVFEIKNEKDLPKLEEILMKNKIPYSREYEIELLLKNDQYMSGVILRGIDLDFYIPTFLENKDASGIVLGSDISSRLNAYHGTRMEFISVAHTDALMGDVPRSQKDVVSDFYLSEISEIDNAYAFSRISFVQNLIRKKTVNIIRIYEDKKIDNILPSLNGLNIVYKSWDTLNSSLSYALKLETNMMIFLFSAMSLLVSLAITSGFMLFFDKIKIELLSIWVLGKSYKDIMKLNFFMSQILSFGTCLIAVSLGILFLIVMDKYSINLMPSFFLEQKIPMKISTKGILLSFFIPYFIASLFSFLSFKYFKKEQDSFVSLLRKTS